MSKLRINDKYLNIIENLFLYLFMAYAMLSTNSFTYGKSVIGFLMWPSMLLGAFIISYRILNFKDYYKMPGLLFLVLMLGSIGVSTVVNYQYSFKSNLLFCVYWSFYFLIIYTISIDKTKAQIKSRMEHLAAFFAVYLTVNVIISFVLLIINYSKTIITADTNYEYYIGFVYGRLWGAFINPNGGAVSAAIATVILIYFIISSKNIAVKVLCAFDVFLQLMYIALSDSRSGAVCVGVSLATFVFVLLLGKFKDKNIGFKAIAVVIAAVTAVAGFMLPRELKDGYNDLSIAISEKNEEKPSDEGEDETSFTPPVIDRGYDLTEDVSNRRFDVWYSGLEIYSSSARTLLIGTGFAGIADYAKEHVPGTYIINNDYAELRTLDNEFFNIMDAQGSLGLLITAAFVLFVLIFIVKGVSKTDEKYFKIITLEIALTVGLSSAAMFSGMMFYHFSQNAVIFWIAIGSLMYLLNNDRKEMKNE